MDMKENIVTLERVINAPANMLWIMLTDSEHFKAWYGPKGFDVDVIKMDAKTGGQFMISMSAPDGQKKMFTTGTYSEVAEPKALSYTESMCDENGHVFPDQDATQVTMRLTDEDGQTKLNLMHKGVPVEAEMGWSQALDKLEAMFY